MNNIRRKKLSAIVSRIESFNQYTNNNKISPALYEKEVLSILSGLDLIIDEERSASKKINSYQNVFQNNIFVLESQACWLSSKVQGRHSSLSSLDIKLASGIKQL